MLILNKIKTKIRWIHENYLRIFTLFLAYFAIKLHKKNRTTETKLLVVLCHKDVHLLVSFLVSMFHVTNMYFPVMVIDDGSLTKKDKKILKHWFNANIYSQITTQKKLQTLKKKYPNIFSLYSLSKNNIYLLKVISLLITDKEKRILIDPDMLCFNYPNEILTWVNNSSSTNFFTKIDEKFAKKLIKTDQIFINKRKILNDFQKNSDYHKSREEKLQDIVGSLIGLNKNTIMNLGMLECAVNYVYKNKLEKYKHLDEILLSVVISSSRHTALSPDLHVHLLSHIPKMKPVLEKKPQVVHFIGSNKKIMELISIKILTKIILGI